jgi:leucyl aminopeptidase
MKVSTGSALSSSSKALVLFHYEEEKGSSAVFKEVDKALKGLLGDLKKDGTLARKECKIEVVHSRHLIKSQTVVVAGLGKKNELTHETIRNISAAIARTLQSLKADSAAWCIDDIALDDTVLGKALSEGIVMGTYAYDEFKSHAKKRTQTEHTFYLKKSSPSFKKGLELGEIVGESVNKARTLANTPCNIFTPSKAIETAKKWFPKSSGVSIEVIDQKKAKALGMNLFLGVAQGSVEPPYMLVLRYEPIKNKKPIALVGKGVTFDSGGISIKPALKMSEMKGDMTGSAAVMSTMFAISQIKPKTNVIGIMAFTENMPSGNALKPGDVVTGMNGKTVEITNTDAEGRLVLADALAYAVSQKAERIVDIATLTGACSIALGDVAGAILGNDQKLVDRLLKISTDTGERLWQLPLYDEYFDYMKSEVADMINASENRLAGTCTGAIFLKQFVNDTPWAHLDIASMMHFSKTSGYTVKGMSGVGVRNLISFVLSHS